MNRALAYGLVVLLLIYFAVELGWGGGGGNIAQYRRPRDPLWPRWRWRPKPPDRGGASAPKPKPRLPELVD